ncbi:MAG: sporulation protein YqfD, partial [Ruminococcus sp.]|nr:sporulation protein YqfD [Ruminococcus sp.]
MKNQLRGYIKFTVRGKRIYSFINALHKSHICCFGQYCKGDIFYGEIYAKSLTTVAELAKKFSLDLNSTECKTLRKKFSRYNKRFGFVFGMIVAIFCCIYFSNSI